VEERASERSRQMSFGGDGSSSNCLSVHILRRGATRGVSVLVLLL